MKKPETPKLLPWLICLRCGYGWPPRTASPKLCPNCKSKFWNEDRSKEPNLERVESTRDVKENIQGDLS